MGNKCTDVDKLRRIKTVTQWLIEGHSHADICHNVSLNWGVDQRQAKRYIADAFVLFKDEVILDIADSRAFHQKARMVAYKELVSEREKVKKNKGLDSYKRVQMLAMLTNQITALLKDMAKIDGLYVEKHEHKIKSIEIDWSS